MPKLLLLKTIMDKNQSCELRTWIDHNKVGAATTMNFVVITPQNTDDSSQTMVKLYNYEGEVVTKMAEDSLRY